MKCIQMTKYGIADILTFKEVSMPEINTKEVLIKVNSVGINPFDLKIMSGMFQSEINQKLPAVIGSDFSGEIIAIGERVGLFKKGMKVYGSGITFAGGSGSLAEYLRVNEDKVGKMPDNIDFASAAAIVTPGCTAQQAVNNHLEVKPGQKILIHGAGGGVGSLAVQLCVNIGAQVAVTVSAEDVAYMKELGADLIINYHKQPFEHLVRDFDGVLDTQGGEILQRSYEVIRPGGRIVSLVAKPDPAILAKYHIIGIQQSTEITTKALNILTFLIEEKILKPRDPEIIPFQNAINAIMDKMNGRNKHKIVIQIAE
ncbi:MAG: NADP-dependent oxidoreductase [Bacteroidales bacterium]